MRIYVETAPVIYTVQQVAPYAATVDARLKAPAVVIVSSEFARMECLVLPFRKQDPMLIQDFDTCFAKQVSDMVAFTRGVFEQAAEIRARHGFKTPDALHLAAAVESACDVFLTNDAHLARFTGVAVEVV